jgi:putative ABC transport system ATP-binding protein
MQQEPLISLTGIRKVYVMGDQEVHALAGANLEVMPNEDLAIMGPSGSGKSTLMNVIGCLDTPTAGEYILNRQAVSELTDNELAQIRNKEIGFVFQTFNLLPRISCLQNVELPLISAGIKRSRRLELAEEALRSVGLGDRITHTPNELSGGQRQRVAVARALVNSPSILLADEPTGNLDSKSGDEVVGLLRQVVDEFGRTTVIVTHDPRVAAHADRIVFLKDGEIVDENHLKGHGNEEQIREQLGRVTVR